MNERSSGASERKRLRAATAPGLLLDRARANTPAIALRAKHLGLYRERTFQDFAHLVADCARGLANLGVAPGERVAIMADACEEWAIADLAAQSLGAIVYGVYPTASLPEIEYQMRDGAACVFIAQDQEYVDRILAIADRLESLRHIVVIDDTALYAYDDKRLTRWAAMMEGAHEPSLDWWAQRVASLKPEAPAFVVYTSGTTGNPKGAVVAHGKHLAASQSLIDIYPTLIEKDHRTIAYLPLCHVLGRVVQQTLPLMTRLTPHYGDDVDDLPATLFEVAPTVLFTVPRFLQKFAAQVLVGVGASDPLKRAAYDAAARIARSFARKRWEGNVTAMDRALYAAAYAGVFKPVLNKIGFDKLELLVSGGAPLPSETHTLWQMFGVNLVEIYGQTETAGGIIAGQRGPYPRPGDVGSIPEGWDVSLSPQGEILVRSPDLFEGYWNHAESTAEAFDAQGRLRTGDVGEWREGKLKLIDRLRDFIVTAGGKTLSPAFIENILRASPYLAEAMVIGHGRKYVTALIEIDFDTVSDWARTHDIAYSGFTNLAANARVRDLIEAEIDKANAQLARVEQIKAFRIIPKALDPEEEGEPVTPTRKIKRAQMIARFQALVDGMYDDAEERLLAQAAGLQG